MEWLVHEINGDAMTSEIITELLTVKTQVTLQLTKFSYWPNE